MQLPVINLYCDITIIHEKNGSESAFSDERV